jgi:tRNA modification GTPase
MKSSVYDTICAISTPAGEGGIAVIRVSGAKSFETIEKIFFKDSQREIPVNISEFNSHSIHYGFIFDEEEQLDEVLISIFKTPNSFTGENVIEVSCHGGYFIANKIVSLLSKLGIRQAEAGEFSKRAFLNGRIDLSQAEAIADLIRSKTDLAHQSSLKQLEGSLSDYVQKIRQDILNITSLIELELDFAEEDVEFVSKKEVKEKITNVISELQNIADSYITGRVIKEGVNLVIAGKPNSGKSSLFNHLLKTNRAIVSDIAGTTRDYLEENLIISGILFKLIDTAGLRISGDVIETEGIKRSYEKMREADLVLFLIDSSSKEKEIEDTVKFYNANIKSDKSILVFTKTDLNKNFSKKPSDAISISIKDEKSINLLKTEMINKLHLGNMNASVNDLIITNLRHKLCLESTITSLQNSISSIDSSMSGEYISLDLRNALMHLGEITGEFTNDEVLHNIFMHFCIGK